MATNLKIDENLLDEALRLGGFATKKDTVNQALKAFVDRLKQREVLKYEGAFEEFDNFDHRKYRK